MKFYLDEPGIGFDIGIDVVWWVDTCPSLVFNGATGLTNWTLVGCCFEWRCCWLLDEWLFTSVLFPLLLFPTWSLMCEGGGEDSGGGGGGPVGNDDIP